MTTTTVAAAAGGAAPVDPIGADLTGLLRTVKLSGLKDTLPERLSLARTRQLGHARRAILDRTRRSFPGRDRARQQADARRPVVSIAACL